MSVLAAALAAVGAVGIGSGVVLEQEAAGAEEEHRAMDPRLLLRLLRRRKWLLGLMVTTTGFGFQVAAISIGELTLVEPIFATHVVFALLVASRRAHGRLSGRDWFGVAATVGGVALFLIAAAPTTHDDVPTSGLWFPVLMTAAVVVGVLFVAAPHLNVVVRAMLLAGVGGIGFGLSDGLIKLIATGAGDHGWAVMSMWPPYAWLVTSTLAFLIQQGAFHSAHVAASLPAASTMQPLTGVLTGALLFAEPIRSGLAIPFEVVAGLVALGGVFVLSKSPMVAAGGRR